METNSKNYDTRASRIPQQDQLYQGRFATLQDSQQHLPQPQNPDLPQRNAGQKPKESQKMSKARALTLANTLKKWLAIASLVGFGTFGGLVSLHPVSTAASQASSKSSQVTSTSTSSSQKSSSFLKQQGGNNVGTSTPTPTPKSVSPTPTPKPVTTSSVS